MHIQFLSHGYNPAADNSVGSKLIELFADTRFHTFTGISAFASQSGIQGVAKLIQQAEHLEDITIIVGIDQKATSKEALEALSALDIDAFIFYQSARVIFHPKIYLFEGDEVTVLIVGSSNLTSNGLFTNVEASLLVEIENLNEEEYIIIKQLKEYFNGLFDHTDPNLAHITAELIDQLVADRIVPTEEERRYLQAKVIGTGATDEQLESLIATIFPKRDLSKIPAEFKSRQPKPAENRQTSIPQLNSSTQSQLLWQSGPLTERDLNIPKGETTNPTGSMLFKKGLLADVDQRHYFRDVIFSELPWIFDSKPGTSHIERTKANFKIIIDGVDNVSVPKTCAFQKYSFMIGSLNILSTIPRYTAGLQRLRPPTRIYG